MGVSVIVDYSMATLFCRRAICYGISALVPYIASMSFNLVGMEGMDGVFRLQDVAYNGSQEFGMFVPFHVLGVGWG